MSHKPRGFHAIQASANPAASRRNDGTNLRNASYLPTPNPLLGDMTDRSWHCKFGEQRLAG
jgi:hypothetical protein